jgi:predicted MPP superfamily phosphohydrolase
MVAYGVTAARVRHRTERITVPISDLPPDLEGLRIVHLTDIHVSEDMPPDLIEQIVEGASALDADLGMLTGDYLAFDQWGLEECVASLSRLKTRFGILGCLGNHEIHTEALERITREFDRRGVDILRGEGRDFRFGAGRLRIVGVDYQRSTRAPLWTVDKLMASQVPNLLLSHNPNVFPHAAQLNFDLTLSGHTHGGQVSVEILEKEISPSRFMSPYVQGLYRQGGSRLYVSRGIGTSGLPIRLGAPPEITLITLTRA